MMRKFLSLAFARYAKKAIVGGVVAGAAVITASADGGLTKEEVGLAVGAFLTGAIAVFVPKNGPKPESSGGDIE